MKILFNKQILYLADELTKHFELMLKEHGIKSKKISIINFKNKFLKTFGYKERSKKN